MKIEVRDIAAVVPYARNPRKNEAAVAKVAASLQEFGWRQPIVVDSKGVVIAGHTRLQAAQHLAMARVPVHIATELTAAQVAAYRLADNRTAEEAEWASELLKIELEDLLSQDFDLGLTGFDAIEIDQVLSAGFEGHTDPDEVIEAPENPVTKPGDLWQMGQHRLLCGDATKSEDIDRLLDGVSPLLMVTDPPYGVNYDAIWRNEADRANGQKIGARAIGKVSNDDIADWSAAWELFPGDVAYVWHAGNKANIVADSLIRCNFNLRAQIIWAKNNIVIGRGDYHPKHEPLWYAVRKGKTGHYCGGRKQNTVWNIDKPMKSETGHSTQKPVECMKKPIENNSSPGQAVYDPFMGSGTTIIAGEMTGRAVYGVEIDPVYVDMTIQRWEAFSGSEATCEGENYAGRQAKGQT